MLSSTTSEATVAEPPREHDVQFGATGKVSTKEGETLYEASMLSGIVGKVSVKKGKAIPSLVRKAASDEGGS